MREFSKAGQKRILVLGTKNKDKLRELKALLAGTKIRVFSLAGFPDCRAIRETGKTFEANARLKARAYSLHTRCLTIADDSGLMVNALKGKPGVYSARFAGPGCTYQDNNKKLLRLLTGKTISGSRASSSEDASGSAPSALRRAKFVSVIAIYDNGKFVNAVKGECCGHIAFEEKGKRGFGYDPVFIPDGYFKTFGELSPRLKNRISHRGKALRLAKEAVLNYLQRCR
jgi:XTP/dITP diphosphohydrolase